VTAKARTVLLGFAVLAAVGAFAAPTNLFPILPASLVQEALRWQTLGPGEQPPTATLLIVLDEPIDADWVGEIAAAGYAIEGRFDPFLVVSAPVTLFIDGERGLDALAFAASTLPAFGNWTNLAPPGDPPSGDGRPAVVAASWHVIDAPAADRALGSVRLLRGLRRMR